MILSPRKQTNALFAFSVCLCFAAVAYTVTERKQKEPKTVQAQSFELIDGSGKVRARLGFTQDEDLVFFVMSNQAIGSTERPEVTLRAEKGGSSLHLSDDNAERRISLNAKNQGGVLQVLSNRGKAGIGISAFDKTGSMISVKGKDEKTSYLLPKGLMKKSDLKGYLD